MTSTDITRPATQLTAKQQQFVELPNHLAFFCGGVGSGKTTAGAHFAYEKTRKYAAVRGIIAANTYRQLHQGPLAALFELLEEKGIEYTFGRKPPSDWSRLHVNPSYKNILSLPNGAQIHCVSLYNPQYIRGLEAGWFWIDEARDTKKEAFEILLTRLRGKFHTIYPDFTYQGRLTSTPNGYNWMYDTFENDATKEPDAKLIRVNSRENPHLDPGFATRLERQLGKRKAEQEIEGRFVNLAAGRAYEFEREKHVGDVARDPALPLMLSFDFNVAPMCAVVLQGQFVKNEPAVRVLDEIVVPDSAQTREVVENFVRKWGAIAANMPVEVYGDVSGHARDTRGCDSDYAIIEQSLKAYFPDVRMKGSRRTNPRVKDRIAAVNALLSPATGPPRLVIDRRCHYLLRDLEQVAFKPGTEHLDQASNPQLTHVSDALGYPIADRYAIRRPTLTAIDDSAFEGARKPRLIDRIAYDTPATPENAKRKKR